MVCVSFRFIPVAYNLLHSVLSTYQSIYRLCDLFLWMCLFRLIFILYLYDDIMNNKRLGELISTFLYVYEPKTNIS